MNVLVYAGPGVAQTSLRQTLASLKSLLVPNYSVQTVLPDALASSSWIPSCALLVLTGGRDLTYLSSLATANNYIKDYVLSGGSYLGFCAGAYYASARVEWEIGRPSYEVVGPRPLQFFPGISRGCVYPGFEYHSEAGARAIRLLASDGSMYHGLYYNGGGEFVDAESMPQTRVLARYSEDEAEGKIAGVACSFGKGKVALWGAHIEYSLRSDPLYTLHSQHKIDSGTIMRWEEERMELLRSTVEVLGLRAINVKGPTYQQPFPQLLVSAPILGDLVSVAATNLFPSSPRSPLHEISDANDSLRFDDYAPDIMNTFVREENTISGEKSPLEPQLDGQKRILLCREHLPPATITPYFDLASFFTKLSQYRQRNSLKQETVESWGMGSLLLYGEAVTSTQTLIDKNPTFMNSVPTPLLSIATHQMSGRGRGANVWLSPAGCLQFSLLLHVPSSPSGEGAYLPPSKLVFVQYLAGIAIVTACREILGQDGQKIRLKWPNDVYALVRDTGNTVQKKKIGGILVTTSFNNNQTNIVIGCAVNVFNEVPTTSLSTLSPSRSSGLSTEGVAAAVISHFERIWTKFISGHGSFQPFIEEYLEYWLHSDEVVTLTTTQPHKQVRITGITLDHGLLRTIPESESWSIQPTYIDLQPDGNSFDMMAGLIKTKA